MSNNDVINSKQLQAINTTSQYVRVIAGAGSGKTFVLIKRIVHLINDLCVNEQDILVLTFTNKACQEIKNRVEKETNKKVRIYTFHSFCVFFLLCEIHNLGFNDFKILDQEDKKKILCEVKKKLCEKNPEKYFEDIEKNILRENYFSEKYRDNYKYKEIISEYEKVKKSKNALDFDDLILKTINIMKNYSNIREKWYKKFKYILIDEFQDTDGFQFELIKNFCNDKTSFYFVGDPDQTIYSWRGAKQEIILNLDKIFKNIETIILNQNYRSSKTILKAANNLIKHNINRIPKDMFTKNKEAEEIDLSIFRTRQEEAKYIANKINFLMKNNKIKNFKDVAILFRSVKNIAEYEKELNREKIPYTIIGGYHFFQKKEVKNIINYVRLLVDHNDDLAFENIINIPKRKIGDKTLQNIKKECEENKISFFNYIENIDSYNSSFISKIIIKKLKDLVEEIKKTQIELEKEKKSEYSNIINIFLQKIGYLNYVQKLKNKIIVLKDLFFLLNIDMNNFFEKNDQQNLSLWIKENTLISSNDEINNSNGDHVYILTIHATKGLEFDYVFIVDMSRTFCFFKNKEEDEEERRTYYVAFTRAKKKLFLSRNIEFKINELPYIREAGLVMPELKTQFFNSYKKINYNDDFFEEKKYFNEFNEDNNDENFNENDIVMHNTLGEGIIKKNIDKKFVQVFFKKNSVTAVFLKSELKKVK